MEQPLFKEKLYNGENNDEAPHGEPCLPCPGHLKKLLNCKTLRTIPPQHAIFSQGESPHTVCIICRGMVKLTRTESDGTRAIVGLRQAGSVLGTAALFLNMPYATTAETITSSKICLVPAETFNQVMETNAEFSRWISTTLSREVRSSLISISEKSCLSGRHRLENFLWDVAKAQSGFDPQNLIKIQLLLKNWEVAQLLALTPQHLCRLIKQMEDEGIVMRKKGWLILSKPKRLWHSEMEPKKIS
ncbi:MAG: Crp/Fnr family transcriptional regulator [Candidatus Deferrimicrobiaceae bacterium]